MRLTVKHFMLHFFPLYHIKLLTNVITTILFHVIHYTGKEVYNLV